MEAKVQELGGELSEEMSDYSSLLGDTASESESGTNSDAEKVEPASSKEQAVPKKKAVAKSSPKAEAVPAEIKEKAPPPKAVAVQGKEATSPGAVRCSRSKMLRVLLSRWEVVGLE